MKAWAKRKWCTKLQNTSMKVLCTANEHNVLPHSVLSTRINDVFKANENMHKASHEHNTNASMMPGLTSHVYFQN